MVLEAVMNLKEEEKKDGTGSCNESEGGRKSTKQTKHKYMRNGRTKTLQDHSLEKTYICGAPPWQLEERSSPTGERMKWLRERREWNKGSAFKGNGMRTEVREKEERKEVKGMVRQARKLKGGDKQKLNEKKVEIC